MRWQAVTLLEKTFFKNVPGYFLICREKSSGLLLSLQRIFRSSFPSTSSRENLMKVRLSFHTREAQKVPIIQKINFLLILMGIWTLVSEWRNLSLLHKVVSFFPPNLTQKANTAAVPVFFFFQSLLHESKFKVTERSRRPFLKPISFH